MDKYNFSKSLVTFFLVICLSSCAEVDKDQVYSFPEDPIILEPSDLIVLEPSDAVTLESSDLCILEPSDPIVLISPPITLSPFTGLSVIYDEYYSGYWKGSLCGGNGEAVIGVNGDSVELNTNANYMRPMFGSIDSLGTLTFTPRQVNWDTDIYGDVRPLEISGVIDIELQTGYINFEVACSNGSLENTISTITIYLKSGSFQPSPYSELFRIKSEAIELIGGNVQSCTEETQCNTFNIDNSDDFCNFSASAYSSTIADENKLLELKSEYSRNKWLSTSYTSSSSTTYCAYYLNATCEENICVMR